jgi:hypothetical protein
MDAAHGLAEISAPFRTLGHAEGNSQMPVSSSQQMGYLVDLIGIEPMTSSMPSPIVPSFSIDLSPGRGGHEVPG